MENPAYGKRELLKKYYEGTCSDEERSQVIAWLANLAYDTVLQDMLKEEWQAMEDIEISKNNLEAQWEKWLQKAGVAEWQEQENTKRQQSKSVQFNPYIWAKWAAAIAIPLVVSLLLIDYYATPVQEEAVVVQERIWLERETKKGQKLSLTLPDGTQIKLNASSHISFPKNFTQGEARIVKLNGEAFFEVTKLDSLPFIVQTELLNTTVLGTAFSVNSYAHNNAQFVAVLEGKVKVEQVAQSEKPSEPIYLVREQMASLSGVENGIQQLEKGGFDEELTFGWKDDKLVFKESSFEDVIEALEAWYGVEFVFADSMDSSKKFTGTFKGKPLTNVLDGLGFSSKFSYEIKSSKVYVRTKP